MMLTIIVIGLMLVGLALVINKSKNVEISFEHPYDRVLDFDQERARVKNNAELSFEHPYGRVTTT